MVQKKMAFHLAITVLLQILPWVLSQILSWVLSRCCHKVVTEHIAHPCSEPLTSLCVVVCNGDVTLQMLTTV